MYQVINCLTTEHDFYHVLTSVLVLCFSSMCGILVFTRSRASTSRNERRAWVVAAGTVMGIGVWATHFIALLGYQPGFPVLFDGWITLLSLLVGIAGFVGNSLILSHYRDLPHRLASAGIATGSVAGMHFLGMSAIKASAVIEYDSAMIAVALLLGGAAFTCTYLFVAPSGNRLRSVGAWFCSLLAVAFIHYVSAAGTHMIPIKGLVRPFWLLDTQGLAIAIAVGMACIVILSSVGTGLHTAIHNVRAREKRKLALLANSSLEALFVVSGDGFVVDLNAAATEMLGEHRDALLGARISHLIQLDDIQDGSHGQDHAFGERSLVLTNGRKRIVDINRRAIDEGANSFIVFAVRDITERLRNEAKVRRLAYSDSLTGLANRVAFTNALTAAMEEQREGPFDLAVLVIDIDEFKEVNDQFGHAAGDFLLKTIALRLQTCLTSVDFVARLGGDEFAVLLRHRTSIRQVAQTAQDMLTALAEPLPIGRRTLVTGASIGIAIASTTTSASERILMAADRALYAAKESGRGCFRLYDNRLHSEHSQKKKLERALHEAVQLDQFELHFQPKVCANSRKVLGREALIRWNRPDFGLVYPDDFIPVAEQSLLINEIGRWTIRAACDAAISWDDNVSVAVNLSARQFLDPDLVEHIRQSLEQSGLDPARLEIEITETALIHNKQLAAAILTQLKEVGVQIALDDFGTGYSSMSYIQTFPFDRIKIDRSFVASMNADRKSRAIVEAIIHLAHSLDIPVVAEGVETEEQANALVILACEELQGYLIARPAPIARIDNALGVKSILAALDAA